MIQAIGLTSAPRRSQPPAVDDLTFEARPGRITALLGPQGAGKTTALRLMLQLQSGRGVALFRGRPLHRVPHPAREIGALLGDVPGHPGRTARGHLRMLTAVAGVPAARADEMLDVVGLSGLADQRLGAFSLGMDRRLGLAAALLGDPHTLVLDEPAHGLSPREVAWLHGLLRGFADQGGLVLTTTSEPKEAARTADRVITLERGRLIADQEAADFARTRLRPRVVVSSPHAERLAALLVQESRSATQLESFAPARATDSMEPIEVVRESGGRIAIYGSDRAMVGETAYRHGILMHQLADEIGDNGDSALLPPLARADGRGPAPDYETAPDYEPAADPEPAAAQSSVPAARRERSEEAELPPRLTAVPAPGPSWPLRYELRRLTGVRSSWLIAAATLLTAFLVAAVLGYRDGTPALRLLTGWPDGVPLPPMAATAGLLGAFAFGQEFRYPALAPAQVPVPRRLGLLAAKLSMTATTAVLLCGASTAVNATGLALLYGPGFLALPGGWPLSLAATVALAVGCAWAGLLAAAVFRSTIAGVGAVLAVPLLIAPVVRKFLAGPAGASIEGLPGRLESLTLVPWPAGADRWVAAAMRLLAQPMGSALMLSLTALFCAYTFSTLRGRTH
ncbi:ATP-binding cassette domain-containing protein [Streptomyces gobiensis]|uniref:ATP-binding cassette domain-containing protein n=1 Tax=Streptomyces gobiensis TaxID=2875706 RepID=UPI001E346BB5|nr:ATP-binding cassette domain-containing protein [Streptomyces gobiensis]UGY94030.1 ATP-binding cassette domain-containing protein [Streptomyces gobiensis]